jgi:hypothetical protein
VSSYVISWFDPISIRWEGCSMGRTCVPRHRYKDHQQTGSKMFEIVGLAYMTKHYSPISSKDGQCNHIQIVSESLLSR